MTDDELIERALLQELSADEEAALASRLRREPPLARRMMELSRDEALLADGVREARASRDLSGAAPERGGRRPSMLWVAALVGVATLLVLFLPRPDAARATILDRRGSVEIDDRDAFPGDRGRVVKTGADGLATLKLDDGSRLLLSGLSHFEVETAERARLHAGSLEVTDGRVRLVRGAELVEVAAGQLASAEPGQPLLVELSSPAVSVPPDFGSGRGLRGEYFDNEDLTNLKLTRIDPVVDFQWGLRAPHPSVDAQHFSVRWRGQVEPLYSETYAFHVTSDDGARLWIDGKPIVDDWTARGTRERTGTIALEAGRRVELRLEYLQIVSGARVSLSWSSASQKKEIVPVRQLYAASSENHLIDEAFSSGALTPGVWTAKLEGARFEPGYLFFPFGPPETSPSLVSVRKFDRKPGLCVAAVHLGNVHRGGLKDENPVVQFSSTGSLQDRAYGGPGWTMGQHMGRYLNTAVPLLEKTGMRSYPVRNDNIDTLFLTVLRERGAFYLTCGEPGSTPPRAKLWHVSHTGDAAAYHVAVSGGRANARFASLTLTDLGGAWAQPYGIATIPPRDLAEGQLLDAAADGQWEVTATASPATKAVGLIVRAKDGANHYRFELTPEGTRLIRRVDGKDSVVEGTGWREMKLVAGKPWRLAVRLEGPTVNLLLDDVAATYGWNLPAVESTGAKVGVFSSGGATFREFVGWPTTVDIPQELAAKIPPVHLKAEGDVVVRDDFEAPDGTPLEGRRPKWGRHPWKVGRGEWVIERGAAVLKRAPGFVRVDCGHGDYELTALIELPKDAPPPNTDWFAAVHARASGPGPIENAGGINARFLWQSGSNEIEVWDKPASTPENVAKWAAPDGPHQGRIITELINATNITPMLRPGQTHALRLLVRGSRVSYFCDDVLVGTANTRVSHGPWVGLNIDANGSAGVRFLDFTVRVFRNR
jgi:hypothetical protein